MNPKYITFVGLIGLAVYTLSTGHIAEAVNALIGAAVVMGWVEQQRATVKAMTALEDNQRLMMAQSVRRDADHDAKLANYFKAHPGMSSVSSPQFEQWKAQNGHECGPVETR